MKQGPNLLVKLEKLNVHKCEKCPRVFPTLSDLKKHISYHDKRFLSHIVSAYVSVVRAKIFKCKKCTQSFDNNRDFMLHKLAHVQAKVRNERKLNKLPTNSNIVKPYKCPDCEVSFAAQSTLDAHSIAHLPFPHICKCGIGYYKEQDLKCHIELVHDTETKADEEDPHGKPEVILQSKLESKSRIGKNINKKSMKKKKPKKKNCKVKLKSVDEGTNGFKLKSEGDVPKPDIDIRKTCDNKFECPECKKLFTYKRHVIQHYRIHTGECPFECHLCPKAFNQRITLKKHIERHFSKERIYVCKHCPKAFAHPDYRYRHEQIHSHVKPNKCPYCGKAFHDQSALTRHKRIHTGDKPYRCPYCPKAFSDASGHIAHKLRHENKKQFPCGICDKRFYNRYDVTKHMTAMHTNKEYFICDYCKIGFYFKYNLMMHILQSHMKINKPFECEFCHNKFSLKGNLTRHLRQKHEKYDLKPSHTIGNNDACSNKSLQKRIQCAKCSQYFASPTLFQEHKLVESAQCDICDKKFFCENMLEEHLRAHFPLV